MSSQRRTWSKWLYQTLVCQSKKFDMNLGVHFHGDYCYWSTPETQYQPIRMESAAAIWLTVRLRNDWVCRIISTSFDKLTVFRTQNKCRNQCPSLTITIIHLRYAVSSKEFIIIIISLPRTEGSIDHKQAHAIQPYPLPAFQLIPKRTHCMSASKSRH